MLTEYYGGIESYEREVASKAGKDTKPEVEEEDDFGSTKIKKKRVAKAEGRTGSLMLAVCRGKVSEGIDFSDNRARGVVC